MFEYGGGKHPRVLAATVAADAGGDEQESGGEALTRTNIAFSPATLPFAALVGDAAKTAFWPQGTGCMFGFFSAFDATDALNALGRGGAGGGEMTSEELKHWSQKFQKNAYNALDSMPV